MESEIEGEINCDAAGDANFDVGLPFSSGINRGPFWPQPLNAAHSVAMISTIRMIFSGVKRDTNTMDMVMRHREGWPLIDGDYYNGVSPVDILIKIRIKPA